MENRQQTHGDQYLPAHGLMITHVDYDKYAWSQNEVNNTVNHQRMTIIPADNRLSNATNSSDLYPNNGKNTKLTDNSTPAAQLFKGSLMGQPITSITETDGVISLKYSTSAVLTPVANEATEIGESSFVASWEPVANATSYTLLVKKASKNTEDPLIIEDFNKFTVSSIDIGNSLGEYMNIPDWIGEKLYEENKGLRLGSSKATRWLVSPTFDLSGSDLVTVQFTAKSYSNNGDATLQIGSTSNSSPYL